MRRFTLLFAGALIASLQAPWASAQSASAADIGTELARVQDRPGGLTSQQVAERARTTSPALRAAEAQVRAAGAEQERAFVGYFPRVTLTARYTRLSPIDQPTFGPEGGNLVVTPAGPGPLPGGAPLVGVPGSALSFPAILNQYLLQANVTVPISDTLLRTRHAYDAANHGRRAAEHAAQAQHATTGANAKLAYYAWARARLSLVVAERSKTQAEIHLEAARALQEADRASDADVLERESQLASAELMVEQARDQVVLGEDRLRTLMHDDKSKNYAIGEALLDVPEGRRPPSFAESYARAQRQRPELRALERNARSLSSERRAASAAGYPRLDGFGNAYYANPNQRYIPQSDEWNASWDVGLQLSWTPNDTFASSAASSALAARHAEVEAKKSELLDGLRQEVFEALRAVRQADVAVRTTARRLTAAEEAYRARAEQFRVGRASSVQLSAAEADVLRARLERVNALIDVRVSQIRLDHAVGNDVRRP